MDLAPWSSDTGNDVIGNGPNLGFSAATLLPLGGATLADALHLQAIQEFTVVRTARGALRHGNGGGSIALPAQPGPCAGVTLLSPPWLLRRAAVTTPWEDHCADWRQTAGTSLDPAGVFGSAGAAAPAPDEGARMPRGAYVVAAAYRTAMDLTWG